MPDEELETASADAPLSPEDEAALAEDVDLDPDTRRRILTLARDLERLDYYALLGVDRGADRKALKHAYYDLAAKFHPDRYFRKKLGSYKPKMEAIFGRITLAHDTLTDRDKRAEYDAYLGEQRRSRAIEELLADALAEVKRAEEKAAREASVETAPPSAPPAPPAPPAQSPPPASRPPPPVVAVPLDARRDALARRLLGGRATGSQRPLASPSTAPSALAPPARTAPLSPEEAMQTLRRRYEERVARAKAAQARKYIANADTAMAAGDILGAANNLRVAVTLTPEDKDLAARAAEAQTRADAMLAEAYMKQAQYEEKNGQWPEAARSWARVCKVRGQDGHAHERAAHAIVKGNGDLHEAARLARHACGLDPENARYRVTLASVYAAAGLTRNARRELETAAQLAPHDGTIQAMLESAGKPA